MEWLAVLLLMAAAALGWAAYRGKVSWGWFAAALSGAALAFRVRRSGRESGPLEPPKAPSAADTVTPILVAVDARSEEEREIIREANEDPDRLERLERLADINNSGRDKN